HASHCICHLTLAFGVSEKNQYRITSELSDGSTVLKRDARHLHKILIEQPRNLFRLQLPGRSCEVGNVGKEDGQLLAFIPNRRVVPATKDAVVDLRWEIAGELRR